MGCGSSIPAVHSPQGPPTLEVFLTVAAFLVAYSDHQDDDKLELRPGQMIAVWNKDGRTWFKFFPTSSSWLKLQRHPGFVKIVTDAEAMPFPDYPDAETKPFNSTETARKWMRTFWRLLQIGGVLTVTNVPEDWPWLDRFQRYDEFEAAWHEECGEPLDPFAEPQWPTFQVEYDAESETATIIRLA